MTAKIGIDLGTTNSVAAYMENGKIEYIKFRNRENIPSVLFYQNDKITIGDKAKKKSNLYPSHYIKSSKTYMGNMDKKWDIDGRIFTPTDVAKEILLEIKLAIEKELKPTQIEAVITVPAYFTSSQIDETKKAGEQAGFIVKRIITEPVSAAIAYGFEDSINQKIFIVDIGGGTFDTAILEVKNYDFNTLAVGGDNKLGGDDFDKEILEIFLKKIRKEKGINLSSLDKSGLNIEEYSKAYQALVIKAEDVKVELTEQNSSKITLANLFDGYTLELTITKEDFERVAQDIMNKITNEIEATLEQCEVSTNNIDKVVLVGGSSKIPIIRNYIQKIFNTTPYADKPLDKLVAMGAAIVVADDNSVQINDIISHSLGVEIVNNRFSPIIPKNAKYPVELKETYTTVRDYQENVNVEIYEGEDEYNVHNNAYYGGFILKDIEYAKKDVPQIEVTFEFDINRILHITAKDLNTGSENRQTIDIDKGSK